MKIVTSFSPNRIERQRKCLDSWLKYNIPIIAIQSPDEVESINTSFSGVEIRGVSLPSSNIFSKNTPTILSLLNVALFDSTSILVVNSDIEIQDSIDQFHDLWLSDSAVDTLRLGIRHDFYTQRPTKRYPQKYGIDVFQLTPHMVAKLPDWFYVFRLGCPGWDFCLPWFLWSIGCNIVTYKKAAIYHEFHKVNWTEEDQASYRKIILDKWRFTNAMLAHFILDVTERNHFKQVNFKK